MGNELYSRRWTIQVGDLRIRDLRVAFNVRKTLSKDPNTAEIEIYNLSQDSRKKIEASKGQPLVLSAGYAETEAKIFSGQVRFASNGSEGPDWKTKIESGDGEIGYAQARFAISVGKGSSARDLIRSAAQAMGVNLGNVDKATATLPKPTTTRGFSASGRASDVLDKLLREQGLRFSIQGGQLQIHKEGEAVDPVAVLLSSRTGLIGSPETTTPKDLTKTTSIKFRSYLQPQFRCGGFVRVKTESFDAQYLVQSVEHVGDSSGAAWYSTVEVHAN